MRLARFARTARAFAAPLLAALLAASPCPAAAEDAGAAPVRLMDRFAPLAGSFGAGVADEAKVVSGPTPVKMPNDQSPGRRWTVALGETTFKVTIQDAARIEVADVLARLATVPPAYRKIFAIVSEGEKAGAAFYAELGGAAAHGSQDYLNMVPQANALVMAHEAGHILEQRVTRSRPTTLEAWKDAVAQDRVSVSAYGDQVAHEDLAEFALVYALCLHAGPGRLEELQALSPRRFGLWEGILAAAAPSDGPIPYPVTDTMQDRCYDERREIPAPKPGRPFWGQDANFRGRAPRYEVSADGRTVLDAATGLAWQRSPDADGDGKLRSKDKLTWAQAQKRPAALNAAKYGGHADWRLPTIKELYSLFDARGTDPSGPSDADTSRLTPFLDANAFEFAWGDPREGERVIDSQYASSTLYTGPSLRDAGKLFGVNFADGRIKGYDLKMPGGPEKTFFVLCVRGNPSYGKNEFRDNGDGTVADRATGLVWAKADSGEGMDWPRALAWVQAKNAERHLGHRDWRLPDAKELQSIVDYGRSPDATQSPSIDPVFECTKITNEGGQPDWPCYWTSTTHAGLRGGEAAMVVAFGRAAGWMSARGLPGGPGGAGGRGGPPPGRPPGGAPPGVAAGPGAGEPRFTDVHGAGAQRSDPKTGDPAAFPRGRGPQGDVIRIYNYVRLVRGGTP